MDNKDTIRQILDFINKETDHNEINQIHDRVFNNASFRNEFIKIDKVWQVSALGNELTTHTDERWDKLYNRINKPNTKSFNYIVLLRIAAIFIVAFILSGIFYQFTSLRFLNKPSTGISKNVNKIVIPYGSKGQVNLPDGTKVWLNAGSSLMYSDNFHNGAIREIILEGEGYFSVAKSTANPFVVHAQGIEIKALGTSFNVKAYKEDAYVEATLVEGIIEVSKEGKSKEEITMKPKQTLKINKYADKIKMEKPQNKVPNNNTTLSEIEKQTVIVESDISTELYTSWKDSKWIIKNEDLSSLTKKLERRYAVTFTFNDQNLKNIRFTGTLKDESLEQVLEYISIASPINFTIDGKIVTLTEDKELRDNFKSIN